jgi:hypothetical protein
VELGEKEMNRTVCGFIYSTWLKDKCNHIIDNRILKDSKQGKLVDCDEIIDQSKRSLCVEWYIYKNKKITDVTAEQYEDLCEMIQDKELKEICYFDLGRNFKDLSFCNMLKTPKFFNACYGIVLSDDSYCDKINDPVYKEVCAVPWE